VTSSPLKPGTVDVAGLNAPEEEAPLFKFLAALVAPPFIVAAVLFLVLAAVLAWKPEGLL